MSGYWIHGGYYVYTLAYPDGTVFYVGKGQDDRIQCHFREAKAGVLSPKADERPINSEIVWLLRQAVARRKEEKRDQNL